MERASKRTIEVTIISAEVLRANLVKPLKKNAFVVVKTDSGNVQSTALDSKGGSFPVWNEKFTMELPPNVHSITLEANRKSRSGLTKPTGAAQIPVSDFCGGNLPKNHLSFLSYRLRDARGGKNGVINLSIQVRGEEERYTGRGWRPSAPPFVGAPVANGIPSAPPYQY